MPVVVMKFGGTSLSTVEARRQAACRVEEALDGDCRVVVVVSAMGRRGDPYATDTLMDLVGDSHAVVSPRELDLLSACGEIIAAVVMAGVLRAGGLDPVVMTGWQAGIVTDQHHADARILRVAPEQVLQHLERGQVVVVAGFQGATESGEITTLGRGGSDTTAAALGVALRAERVEIYTDVEGIKTADPRLVPDARTLAAVTFEELVQMSVEGARVVHPRAVQIAMRGNVPIRVRSTFVDDPGTLITHTWESEAAWPDLREGRVITGVAHMPGRTLLTAWPEEGSRISDLEIFRTMADAGISVDMINVSPHRKAFIVTDREGEQARGLLEDRGLRVESRPGCAKVTVVGTGMRGLPGVMAGVVEALDRAGVDILLSVDSHITISCLVRGEDLERAVRALHRQFQLGGEGE